MANNLFSSIHTRALLTLQIEAEAIKLLYQSIDSSFCQCVARLLENQGRVIVTGVGKSAIIARKIAATLSSTGTSAFFMHASDALHGDVGMIQSQDFLICISNSGNTSELKQLIPIVKKIDCPIAAIVGNKDSILAKEADYLLYAAVSQEACPNNLAPTASTMAQMAMGDALAMCLQELRHFTPDDFARVHPSGSLGKQLLLVEDLYPQNLKPFVYPNTPLKQVIMTISSNRLGVTAVVDEQGRLLGVITDGDLRRAFQANTQIEKANAIDIMTAQPLTVQKGTKAVAAKKLMSEKKITQLLIMDGAVYVGVLHIHDLG